MSIPLLHNSAGRRDAMFTLAVVSFVLMVGLIVCDLLGVKASGEAWAAAGGLVLNFTAGYVMRRRTDDPPQSPTP